MLNILRYNFYYFLPFWNLGVLRVSLQRYFCKFFKQRRCFPCAAFSSIEPVLLSIQISLLKIFWNNFQLSLLRLLLLHMEKEVLIGVERKLLKTRKRKHILKGFEVEMIDVYVVVFSGALQSVILSVIILMSTLDSKVSSFPSGSRAPGLHLQPAARWTSNNARERWGFSFCCCS